MRINTVREEQFNCKNSKLFTTHKNTISSWLLIRDRFRCGTVVNLIYHAINIESRHAYSPFTRAVVVHLNFRAGGSIFPVPVCTVPNSMDMTSRCNKIDAVRLYASYRLNLLLLEGQRCVFSCLSSCSFVIIRFYLFYLESWS